MSADYFNGELKTQGTSSEECSVEKRCANM